MGHKPAKRPLRKKTRRRNRKRELIRKNRADLREQMKRAPRMVPAEYRRCQQKIRRLLRARAAPTDKIESVLYPAARRNIPLNNLEINWLWTLLSHPANGWDVSLTKVVGESDDYDDEARLIFRFDPHEED